MQADKEVNPRTVSTPRTLVSSLQQMQEIQLKPLKCEKERLRTKYGVKESPNPMLSLPGDLFQ